MRSSRDAACRPALRAVTEDRRTLTPVVLELLSERLVFCSRTMWILYRQVRYELDLSFEGEEVTVLSLLRRMNLLRYHVLIYSRITLSACIPFSFTLQLMIHRKHHRTTVSHVFASTTRLSDHQTSLLAQRLSHATRRDGGQPDERKHYSVVIIGLCAAQDGYNQVGPQ
ncbi:hypothetical protein BDZ85DRAFT_258707 [Elsinoe ampelina]|uniref:Uncharacterized protein n=1 Tax=Elsinoe ampelina TaxID=302913 RepID=A0A6A6GKJ9_9PEZI|nr:hypothetical protein BDZ85DRAFT_258707 [Elsinoe ampelina]